MQVVSQQMLAWHKARSENVGTGKARSILMYTEDLDAQRFTELAEWLGLPCTFHQVPHANDPDATGEEWKTEMQTKRGNGSWASEYYHRDYASINVTCAAKPQNASEWAHSHSFLSNPEPKPEPALLFNGYDAVLREDDEGEECRDVEPPPSHPECVPPKMAMLQELQAHKSRERDEAELNISSLPRFYIHEDGVFNFTPSLKCWHRAIKGTYLVDDLDLRLFPDISEHLVDLWLLERLRQHPARVMDPSKAHLHVIGSPLVAAFRTMRGEKWDPSWHSSSRGGNLGGPFGCGTIENFYQRVDAIADHLNNSFYWQRHNGRDWLMLNSYYWVKDILGEKLFAMLAKGPAIFTTSDRNFKHFEEIALLNGITNVTVVPYKANHMLDDHTWVEASYGKDDLFEVRPHSIMFHGSTERGKRQTSKGLHNLSTYTEGEGSMRQLLCDYLEPAITNTSLKCVWRWRHLRSRAAAASLMLLQGGADFSHKDKGNHLTWLAETGRRANPTTTKKYIESTFCLVPEGDTPTSRRLFDAMAGGCIPVIMTNLNEIQPNLPFPTSIDWSKVALYSGGLSCAMADKHEATVKWFQDLLKPEHAKALGCMRRRAKAAYRKHMSYRGFGVATALLYELQRDARFADMLNGPVPPSDPAMDATACTLETQCGCKGNNRSTYYIRYHKTGSTLSGQLVHDMSTVCAIESETYTEHQSLAASADGSCRNVKLSLDPRNLDKYTREVLYDLTRPGRGKRFVHMIREPLSLVAAFYTYHMSGKESGEGDDIEDLAAEPVFAEIFANISQMPMRDGVRFVAELVMAEQLPTMVYVKEQLAQMSGTPRSDSLEVRLEDMIEGGVSGFDWRTQKWRTYDEMVNRLAEFGGIPQPCVQQGTKLQIGRAHV